jgi:mannan endo-1,4-beta-mannosidase
MPIVFRPFHEHNGDWFWWGKGIASEEDYIKLWRFTIEYLRDEKGVHNLLYSFSPDRSRMKIENIESDYFYAYPGDDYVDIFGFDDYWDAGYKGNKAPPEERLADFITALEAVVRLAEARGKIPALTETGLDALPQSDWYTSVLLKASMRTRPPARSPGCSSGRTRTPPS